MAEVAYGFVVDGAPTERYTSGGGMEASVTFFGPASNRMQFLEYIFGRWDYANWVADPGGDEPTAMLPRGICWSSLPRPYVSLSEIVLGECYLPSYAGISPADTDAHCLWPDTWEVSAADPNSKPEFVGCVDPISDDPEERPMYRPIDYSCSCYVTVHYRHKHNGCWPLPHVRRYGATSDGGVPDVPAGTYIDVKTRTSGEVQTIEGQGLKFGNPGAAGPSSIPGASWEDPAATPTTLPAGVGIGTIVSTTQMDITWSGVPFPPWDVIDDLRGRVNKAPFLGNPIESVCFFGAEFTTQGSFGCVTLYNIHYSFVIKTSSVFLESSPTPLDYENAKMIANTSQIGIWNRRACISSIKYGNSIVTNYVPIFTKNGDTTPFRLDDGLYSFSDLFRMRNGSNVLTSTASALACT